MVEFPREWREDSAGPSEDAMTHQSALSMLDHLQLPDFFSHRRVSALVGSRTTESLVASVSSEEECRQALAFARGNGLSICPRGSGHSYGDLALNDRQLLLDTTTMNRILEFDEHTGRIVVEPGVKIIDIYKRAHHHRFTLPASPTEATITVAGAISANVNGKDSWRLGNFGDQVLSLKLLTAAGETITIDRDRDRALFLAVVGGLGLLGIILEATLQLQRIPSPFLEISRLPVHDLEELFQNLEQVEATSDFAVVWLDVCARGKRLGRGVIHATKWVQRDATPEQLREEVASGLARLVVRRRQALALYGAVGSLISVLLHAQKRTVSFFNRLYFAYSKVRRSLGSSDNVEKFLRYNFDTSFTVPPAATVCGPLGFAVQLSVSRDHARQAIREVIEICQSMCCPPVTTIMRLHRRDEHLISFSEDGYSLNFEFHLKPRHLERMGRYLDQLLDCVIRNHGRVHLAKEMVLSREQFQKIYPEYRQFLESKQRLDPEELFSSDLYRRLIRTEDGAAVGPGRASERVPVSIR